jgi:YegS/Rv2252/BmrU family lipid kinase
MKTAVVLNPRAAAGRAGAQWPRIEAALNAELGDWTPLRTERPGHATDLVRQALRDGFERIVSIGGDGTHHEVVNGFFDEAGPVNREAVLAIVPIGTGSDFGRTLRLPPGAESVPLITRGRIIRSDLGRVAYTLPDGGTSTLYFINVADFGAGGAVAERVNNSSKGFGGFWSFFWGVLSTLLHYRAPQFELQLDNETVSGRSLSVIVANAEYYGGGIHVAPRASLEDGLLDVFVLADMSIFRALLNLRRFYVGDIYDRPKLVRPYQVRRLEIRSADRVLINLDGEQPGLLPATVEAIPQALRLVTGR